MGAAIDGMPAPDTRRALSSLMFFPRGGSAHAARGLARELPRHGWSVRLLSGSRRDLGPEADALTFYRGLEVRAVDYTEAVSSERPLEHGDGDGGVPMHPSYEDRPGAPDKVFATLDQRAFERQVRAWGTALESAGARSCDVLHLHHLTPINEAAARLASSVPVVGQLHGTELLMLERIAVGPPRSWTHAGEWAERMRQWAHRCEALLVSPGGLERAVGLLGVERESLVPVANGVDTDRFQPRRIDRLAHWRRHLVESPRGWAPGQRPGSVAYEERDLAPFNSGVVLVYLGRFTEVKRLPLLLRAYSRAQEEFTSPAALVLLGGYPGEWEGKHPVQLVAETGARNVFLAGWHDQSELPPFLAASDVIVLPSGQEQFGQALIEGMACGLPAIAARSFGAQTIVEDGRSGWVVPADDEGALSGALVEGVNDDVERRRRSIQARDAVLRRYSWHRIGARVAALFEAVADAPRREGEPLPETAED